MMRLAAPEFLAVIGLAATLAVVWSLRRRWQRFPFPSFGPESGGGRRVVSTSLAGMLAAAVLVPVAVALARPQEVLSQHLERAEGVDIIVVLDVSGSMAALDFQPTDRLGVAKEVIESFLDRRPSDRFGLVVFAGAAVTMCPLTLDHEVAGRVLEGVRLDTLPDGTAIGMGLGTAVTRLRSSTSHSRLVVLVTDGSNNAGQLDPVSAADLASAEGVTVHTVLVGRGGEVPVPVKIRDPRTGREIREIRRVEIETNPELLAEISRRTGGMSFEAHDPGALARVFSEIDGLEKTEFSSTRLVRYRERFEPWAAAALGLLLVAVLVEGLAGRSPW